MNSNKGLVWIAAVGLSIFVQLPALAQSQDISARISGDGGNGKCTFEVVVQGAAEVQIRGGEGTLATLAGGPAQWRRLDCNQPLPYNPANFKFSGVDGHGRQTLAVNPNSNNGVAVIQIENNTGGNEGYTGEITWNGGDNSSNNSGNSNWNSGNNNGNWDNGNNNRDGNNNWSGQSQSIHAQVSGGSGRGKCTFEVVVNGVAEVQIRGDQGRLRTLSGNPAQWRRLDCNQPLPLNPGNFRFSGVDGHGQQSLGQNPNSNNGVAVIRIDNRNRGNNEGYTGTITWNGGRNNSGNWSDSSNSNWSNSGNANRNGGVESSAAGQACQDIITVRIRRDHQNVTSLRTLPNTISFSQQSNNLTNVQGEGQYQTDDGNSSRFSFDCVYDERNRQIVQSGYRQ